MKNKRVLMDLTMTARWRRGGVMVGIVRVACEMFNSLRRMTEVYMVQLEKKDGKEEPFEKRLFSNPIWPQFPPQSV